MTLWTIIPVKPLRLAKSRLATVLTPEQRQRFAETMLRHVLAVVREVPQISGTLVISRDNRALTIAREYGAKTVQESGAPELNVALLRASQIVASWRGDAVLVLPADLPMIQPADVNGILQAAAGERSLVIATDRNHDGTNALYLRPPDLIPFAYGVGSFERHQALARSVGVQPVVYQSERLLYDIDVPEDITGFYHLLSHRTGDLSNLPLSQVFDEIQQLFEQRMAL